MVMNFDLGLDPTSIIIFTAVTFSWGKGLLLVILSHMERFAISWGSYSQIKYAWDHYTPEEFKEYKNTAELAVTYNIYYAFYEASAIVAIVIFEAFHAVWQLSEMLASKWQLRNESVISLMYLLVLRTLFFIVFFPINILELRITRQAFGGYLLVLLWNYFKDLLRISLLTFPAFHMIKRFKRNIIVILSAVYFVGIMGDAAISFNFFTTLEPLEDGLLRKILEEKVLPEIDFSINDIYHSNDEGDEKVYLYDKWFQKTLIINGPLPVDTNVSLIGDSHGSVQFTTYEVVALIVFKIGKSSKGYIFSTILSTVVHLFTLTLVCWHLYDKEYVLHMAGFRRFKPVIANMVVVWYFIILPYWTFVFYRWSSIYEFTQLTEAQFMVSHFNLQDELISALVKLYKLNKEFPYHHYWFAIFNGYRRPLHTLVVSIAPPDMSEIIL